MKLNLTHERVPCPHFPVAFYTHLKASKSAQNFGRHLGNLGMELEEIRMDSGSAVVDRKAIEKIISEACGKPRQLDPRVFNMEMCGSRLLVVRDVSPEEYTPTEGGPSIIIPETARIKDPPGAGWVIAVGEMVGAGTSPHPHGVRLECPSDLLYKRIVFGMWGGKEFRTDLRDGGFETSFWIMTDRDIWAIDNA